MEKKCSPLDVSEKLNTKPFPLVGSFDQPGNIGHHEATGIRPGHDPQLGSEGCERIVGDLGVR